VPDRILLVDDDVVVRGLLARAFRDCGFDVEEAGDGVAGLEAFRAAAPPFNLVITDSRMPRMIGVHLAEHLRQLESKLPIIHLSGSHGPAARCMPPGVPTFYKPFSIDRLMEVAKNMIQGR
jgi:CheY-like chemotaxis protein